MKQYIDDVKNELNARMDKIESLLADTRNRLSNLEVYVVSIDKRVKKLERSGGYGGGFVSDNVVDFVRGKEEEDGDE